MLGIKIEHAVSSIKLLAHCPLFLCPTRLAAIKINVIF